MIYLAADVGGTFTDLVLVDSSRGKTVVEKVPSGRSGKADSIATGIARITGEAELTAGDVDLFVHGFTVATNAFLTRKGARAVLVVTAGFRDILEIGSQQRPRLYPLRQQKPPPIVPRARIVEVAERLDAFGSVVGALSEAEIARVVAEVGALDPEAVAICLNFSFLDDRHERRLAEALAAAFPSLPLYLSSAVNPQMEEYPRANTTALAAYVGLVVDRYLGDVEAKMAEVGARCPLRLMRSDGGVATPRAARANPAHMMLSGPAAGVIAGRELGQRLGRRDLVTFDMGGTSADFSVIVEGEPRTVRERAIAGQPLRLPSLDIESISAGGGSIAWVDRAGGLKVGPDSAGAVPGPACYGQGGRQPTVTDAAVVLGLIDPARYLGGRVKLDAGLAAKSVRQDVARPLGLGLEEAAAGIVAIANVQMIQAIRTISVERGLDVRRFALLAFGGAGPLFAPYLAAGLDMAEVLVPRHPGVFCAEGLLVSDIRHTAQLVHRRVLSAIDVGELSAKVLALRAQLVAELAADGIEPASRRYRLAGDLRYLGQFHELELALPLPGEKEWWDTASIAGRFHDVHRIAYGHAETEAPIELVNLRLTGLGRLERPPAATDTMPAEPHEPAPSGEGPVYLDRRTGFVPCRHYDRAAFAPGARIRGPALIHQLDTTVLVMPDHVAAALAGGVLAITLEFHGKVPMNIDPIDRDTFQHEIVSAAEEMSMALRRSAYSSIIWDMYDYACGLLLPNGEMLAQAETIPAQLGIMRLAAQHMLQAIPLENWREGDVLVCNDPYRGCTHTPDIVLFSPIFHEGAIIAISSTIAHHIDVGGKVPGTEAADSREVFEEGLILPPLKLVEAGRPSQAIFDIIAANVRDPKASAGDLRAQIAGCHTGERRVQALVRRYGVERFRALCTAVMDYAETYVRRSLVGIGQGSGEATVLIEDGFGAAEPIAIRVRATVQGDRLVLDFAGTSAQRDCGLNCPPASTFSMVHYAVKALLAPSLPQNEGCNRPIEIRLPEGTVLSPRRPAAVSVRHLTQQALADAVLKALTPLVPATASAAAHVSFPTFCAGGLDDRPGAAANGGEPGYFLISDIIGGGMGGYPGGDGIAAVDTHGGNCALLSAEVLETMSPIRVRRSVLVPGSGGDGEFRGGLAMERDYEILAKVCTVSGYFQQGTPETAPWGWAGGGPGGLAGCWLQPAEGEARALASKHIALRLKRGDVIRYRSAGGGGWGDPAKRSAEARVADREAGYVG